MKNRLKALQKGLHRYHSQYQQIINFAQMRTIPPNPFQARSGQIDKKAVRNSLRSEFTKLARTARARLNVYQYPHPITAGDAQ